MQRENLQFTEPNQVVSFHWLRVLEKIIFKIAVQTYRVFQSPWRCRAVPMAVRTTIADIPSRQRLRSSSSDDLIVFCCQSQDCLSTIGRRAFPCRWRSHMERPTGRCHLSTISSNFQKSTKTASVSTFISWPCL